MLSRNLEQTLHRALGLAIERPKSLTLAAIKNHFEKGAELE